MHNLRSLKHQLHSILQGKGPDSQGEAFTLSSAVFTSPQRLSQERRLFESRPRIIFDQEELLQVKATTFHNSCPHRGSRLRHSSKEGVVTCPYHGWTFDEEGILLKSTGPRCPYRPGSLRLERARTKGIAGNVFLDPQDGLNDELAQELSRLAPSPQLLRQSSRIIRCDWKLLVESLLETYHFPFAHGDYLGPFENAFFSLRHQVNLNARIAVPLDELEISLESEDLRGINLMYFIFPGSFILLMPTAVVTFGVAPEDLGSCKLTTRLLVQDEGPRAHTQAHSTMDFLERILAQDFEILEGQQRSFSRPRKLRYTPYEDLIGNFHRNLELLLGDELNFI